MMTIMGKQYSRRGVSVVIASLLLIAIAVAAAVLLYVFSIGLMGSLGSSGGQQTKDQVILEAYDWSGTSKCSTAATILCLSLKNVGSSTVNLLDTTADYFVNGAHVTGNAGCPAVVTPGQATCTEALTVPALTPGAAYPIKVVLPDGGVFSYTAIDGHAG